MFSSIMLPANVGAPPLVPKPPDPYFNQVQLLLCAQKVNALSTNNVVKQLQNAILTGVGGSNLPSAIGNGATPFSPYIPYSSTSYAADGVHSYTYGSSGFTLSNLGYDCNTVPTTIEFYFYYDHTFYSNNSRVVNNLMYIPSSLPGQNAVTLFIDATGNLNFTYTVAGYEIPSFGASRNGNVHTHTSSPDTTTYTTGWKKTNGSNVLSTISYTAATPLSIGQIGGWHHIALNVTAGCLNNPTIALMLDGVPLPLGGGSSTSVVYSLPLSTCVISIENLGTYTDTLNPQTFTISYISGKWTITRSAHSDAVGNFNTDGIVVGSSLQMSGWANSSNNGTFTVHSVSSDGTSLSVNETLVGETNTGFTGCSQTVKSTFDSYIFPCVFPTTSVRVVYNQCLSTSAFIPPASLSPPTKLPAPSANGGATPNGVIGWGLGGSTTGSTMPLTGILLFLTHGLQLSQEVSGIYDISNNRLPVAVSGTVVSSSDTPAYNNGPYNASIGFALNDLTGANKPNVIAVDFPGLTGNNVSSTQHNYLSIPNVPSLQLSTGNFTVEFWVRAYVATASGIIGAGYSAISGSWVHGITSGLKLTFIDYTVSSSARITSTLALTLNTWYHVALVRNGTTVTMFINGNSSNGGTPVTLATNYNNSAPLIVGASLPSGSGQNPPNSTFGGYLQDVRITVGLARYTGSFTPPSYSYQVGSSVIS